MTRARFHPWSWRPRGTDQRIPGMLIENRKELIHIPAHQLRELADAAHDIADLLEENE